MLAGQGLTKRYGARLAVTGLDLAVHHGEIVGLLGPNGAGKTTTLSMLAGVLPPDAGEVRLEGRPIAGDADPAKRKIGLVPQDLALYEPLTARANLRFFGALQGLGGAALESACHSALALAGLQERADERVEAFSGGMKRRLNLAAGILHEPDVILLDEPTVGVDPQSRAFLFTAIQALKGRGKAVLYTSHYLEEVERLCDRVVVLDGGRIVADGATADIAARFGGETTLGVELDTAADPAWIDAMATLPGVVRIEVDDTRVAAVLAEVAAGVPAVLAFLAARGARVRSLATERATLEDAFLALTGKGLRDP
jgi:ABC-2 type transport system ATP-binding protein